MGRGILLTLCLVIARLDRAIQQPPADRGYWIARSSQVKPGNDTDRVNSYVKRAYVSAYGATLVAALLSDLTNIGRPKGSPLH